MGGNRICVTLENSRDVQRQLRNIQNAPANAIQKVTTEAEKRVPAWIAKEVTQTYNIKKAEVSPSAVIKGQGNCGIEFLYKGRVLTPVHFGLTPKRPSKKGSYTLKMQVYKGQKKTLGVVKKNRKQDFAANLKRAGGHNSPKSPIMLLSTGNRQEGGVDYIPFQRVSQNRKDLEVIKTVSVPQMISNPDVQERVYQSINQHLGERLKHYMERAMNQSGGRA